MRLFGSLMIDSIRTCHRTYVCTVWTGIDIHVQSLKGHCLCVVSYCMSIHSTKGAPQRESLAALSSCSSRSCALWPLTCTNHQELLQSQARHLWDAFGQVGKQKATTLCCIFCVGSAGNGNTAQSAAVQLSTQKIIQHFILPVVQMNWMSEMSQWVSWFHVCFSSFRISDWTVCQFFWFQIVQSKLFSNFPQRLPHTHLLNCCCDFQKLLNAHTGLGIILLNSFPTSLPQINGVCLKMLHPLAAHKTELKTPSLLQHPYSHWDSFMRKVATIWSPKLLNLEITRGSVALIF